MTGTLVLYATTIAALAGLTGVVPARWRTAHAAVFGVLLVAQGLLTDDALFLVLGGALLGAAVVRARETR